MAVKAMRIQRLTKDAKENLLEDLLKRSPNNYGQYEQGVQEILAHVKEEKDHFNPNALHDGDCAEYSFSPFRQKIL